MAKNKKELKTNVMRLLEQAKAPYKSHYYTTDDGAIDGCSVAEKLGENPQQVFKTLVCQGSSKNHYVFIIPVEKALDLKKAAAAAGEKSIAMIPQKTLLPTTGYVHGGCSPIGMKKALATFLDESSKGFETIFVSAGKIGVQVELSPDDLIRLTGAMIAPISKTQ